MSSYLVVRAVVHDMSRRDDFDRWYETRHLPDAKAAFGALSAWRGWSDTDPSVHFAFYELADREAASAVLESSAIAALIAEFDATWGDAVSRSREVVTRWAAQAS